MSVVFSFLDCLPVAFPSELHLGLLRFYTVILK